MSEEPNYPVIELQAENLRLKDELIDALKKRLDDLEREVQYLHNIINWRNGERDVGSNMIGPVGPPLPSLKPKIRTVSEIAKILETRSLNAISMAKSAEDINEKPKNS